MELIKKNIHMEREKCRTVTQVTIEEDVNIRDQAPDALKIVTQQGKILLEEAHPFTDYIILKGKLLYSLLYLGEEDSVHPYYMNGVIPFEEKVHMDGVTPGDNVNALPRIEDLSVSLINSRKVSIRALVTWKLYVEEIFDEEAVTDIISEDMLEICKKPINVSSLCASTKDVIRMKEEIELPSGMPNVFELIWKDIRINGTEYRLMDNAISVQGEISCFFMYEGEGEERPVQCYETTRTFSQNIEVDGCQEDMIPDISFSFEHVEVEVRPDFDGEERTFLLDIAVNISIKLMETKSLSVITDVYGITKDIDPVLKPTSCSNLLMKNTAKMKLSQIFTVPEGEADILQLCNTSANLYPEEEHVVENGLELTGVVTVNCIYMTKNNDIPYGSITGHIPYQYMIEIPGIEENDLYRVEASIEQQNSSMSGGNEVDVKMIVVFRVLVFKKDEEAILCDVVIQDTDMEKRDKLPGMVVYVAKEHDTIWNVGKKYCVPMQTIRDINQLSKDELNHGDKVLIIKEMV